MSITTNMELTFSDVSGALKACRIAETLIRVYYGNNYTFLRFADMRPENADGYIHYPIRRTRYEEISSFTDLWRSYLKYSSDMKRKGLDTDGESEERIVRRGCRLTISECEAVVNDMQFTGKFFEDFMSLLCLISATTCEQTTFEGMCRTEAPQSYEKKILTHIVYDGSVLTFEQLEGEPVYSTVVSTWTRRDDKLFRSQREFPFIRVDILSEDRDAVRQDKELGEWLRGVNTIDLEMRSAELCILNEAFNPYANVMIHASSRELCEKLRDELCYLMEKKGYRTEFFSIYNPKRYLDSPAAIPGSATMIDKWALRYRDDLRQITIPESLTHIGEGAFEGCSSLTRIMIPDSVETIESFAFMDCVSLREVALPKGLSKLEYGLFLYCRSLEQIELPESLTEIEDSVFSGCSGLKSIAIPPKVKSVGDRAFKNCTGLESIVIPESVAEIGEDVFEGCSPDMVIRGKKGSEAERYAEDHGISFEEV